MNTTIRTIIYAAAVVLAAVSCQKSAEPVQPAEEGKETIDICVNGLMGEYTQVDGTKAELVNTVRVSWKGGETVYVYDGTQCLGSLAASLEGTEDRSAVLSTDGTHTVSTPADGTTTLTLVYSPLLTEAPAVSNDAISISLASQSGEKAPFVAYATLDYTSTTITNAVVPFKFATSVIKMNCTGLKPGTAITSATLSNVNTECKLTLFGDKAPVVAGGTNGTITRTGDSYFAAGKINAEGEAVFQIAVPALETASDARVLTVEQGSGKVEDKNFSMKGIEPATSVNTVCQLVGLPAGALPGEFSVSATKKVHFSKGNLTYDVNASTDKWKFYEHQYDYATDYDANLISLFTWGYDATKSIVPNGTEYVTGHTTDGETFSKSEDWGYVFGGESSVWRTLTTAEWTYLFNNHTKKWATVNGVNGYVIAPDGFEGELADSYENDAELVTAGNLVFLPAAGDRIGFDVSNVGGNGSYWSSTAYGSLSAFRVYFNSRSVYPGYSGDRGCGFSVRLITESK